MVPNWQRIKPVLAAVQNNFLGRFYSLDLILIYRAISKTYGRYPSTPINLLGLAVHSDVVQVLGYTFLPAVRYQHLGDLCEIKYNEDIKNTLSTLRISELRDAELWAGFDKFTAMLREDAEKTKLPFKTPAIPSKIPKLELAPKEIERLSEEAKFIYYIYLCDQLWADYVFEEASRSAVEFMPILGPSKIDILRMCKLYTEWIKHRLLGTKVSNKAKLMTKTVLLSNYRWYMLTVDLLHGLDEAFRTRGFRRGMDKIADMLRREAEGIRVTPVKIPPLETK